MNTDIPREFYIADLPCPVVRTVKQLKEQLARLPDDLPIECGFGDAELVVFNHGQHDMHLEVREHDGDDD